MNLLFQKVVRLPKSQWPALRDRTVNIPVFEADVIKTVESLPRTPSEAGIIPVKLKRKMEYKTSHKIQYISVEKVLQALNTLKMLGNRYYQFIPDFQAFKNKCEETDKDGYDLLFKDKDEKEAYSKAGKLWNSLS